MFVHAMPIIYTVKIIPKIDTKWLAFVLAAQNILKYLIF